jgi:hypothetical protein
MNSEELDKPYEERLAACGEDHAGVLSWVCK